MKIIELNKNFEKLYCRCLEDWSDEMKESGDHKELWYGKMKDKSLRVMLAVDDKGDVGGMIQYLPIEHSFVEGKDLYFITCIWVHGYNKGRGNFQKKGMGSALLKSAEEDARQRGASGIAAWGVMLPFWMRAAWFKKQGYKKVERMGIQELLWKPFKADAVAPSWIHEKKKPEPVPGKVMVTALINGWCPSMNIVFERAKRAAHAFGDKVIFQEVDTSDRSVFLEWGIADALFIDNKKVGFGPPASYERISKLIAQKLKKL